MSTLRLRICDDADRPLLHALRNHVEHWLAEHGRESHQDPHWSKRAHTAIDAFLDQRRFVALCDEHWPLAVGALAPPDRDFWTEDDDLHSAWYIARMMTAHHGAGYGSQLLEMIAVAAAANGRRVLRLDCMRENTSLHNYYRAQGFQLVRIVEHPDRESGALFARPVIDTLPPPWDASVLAREPRGVSPDN